MGKKLRYDLPGRPILCSAEYLPIPALPKGQKAICYPYTNSSFHSISNSSSISLKSASIRPPKQAKLCLRKEKGVFPEENALLSGKTTKERRL